ncbi:hypothetical protein, partial [Candidatus Endomicrobiellum devescovinae]|uniref:hypothetical protein n=1 Tax=Candidatus Endomicrobiellum devescovinae TaxID=3242322 RepID=UPI00282D99CB|nr:hypothetical protein [Endomicrobium sp.]
MIEYAKLFVEFCFGLSIKIKACLYREEKFVFIKGNFVDFSRMVLNLVSNGIESVEGKKADIEI